MSTFKTMFKNGWTTFTGFLAGFTYYIAQNGTTLPTNKKEWLDLLIGATLAALGLTAKSATVGSKPQ